MKKTALLALIFALALGTHAQAESNSTPDDDCPGAHFCEPEDRGGPGPDDVWDGEGEEEREPGPDETGDGFFANIMKGGTDTVFPNEGEGGVDTFYVNGVQGRIGPGRPDRDDGRFCPRHDPRCREGRPGHGPRPGPPGHGPYPGPHPGPGPQPVYPPPHHDPGPGYPDTFVTERLILNRPVRFESLEINMMLGRQIERLRGYELTGVQVMVVEGGGFRPTPGGVQADLALVINGRVEDSVRVVQYGGRGSHVTAYNLRPYRGVDLGFRGERVQVAVQGDLFVSEIQLSFRRLR